MRTRSAPTKFEWVIDACMSVIVPALIWNLRTRGMCPILGLKSFDFLPLWGYVLGAHFFTRLMHDLTHPIFLLSYTVLLGYLAILPMRKSLSARSSLLLA